MAARIHIDPVAIPVLLNSNSLGLFSAFKIRLAENGLPVLLRNPLRGPTLRSCDERTNLLRTQVTACDILEQAEPAALTMVGAIILLQMRSAAFRAMCIDCNVIPSTASLSKLFALWTISRVRSLIFAINDDRSSRPCSISFS